ncbi:MAG: PP2C family serine/threonine-protein phosphatase [Rubripirellula sp.]
MSDFDNDNLPSSSSEESVASYGATDRGRVRETNQDQFLIAGLSKSMSVAFSSLPLTKSVLGEVQGRLLLVADGMGGHAAGERASRLAIDGLVHELLDRVQWFFEGEQTSSSQYMSTIDDSTFLDDPRNPKDADEEIKIEPKEQAFIEDLREALRNVHSRILLESAQHAEQRGMGTTLTMALLVWPRMYVLHAGDSRCYLVRGSEVEQLTTDHTLARQMVEAGGLSPEDEATSKWSNVLWNVLGGRADGDLIAEVRRVTLEPGDSVILCSDGLHRYIDNNTLASVVSGAATPAAACERLIELANEAGGEDNITVIVSQPSFDDGQQSTLVEDFDTVLPH